MAQINHKKKELEEKLNQINKKEEEKKTKLLAEKYDLPYLNLNIVPIDPDDVSFLPKEKALEGNLAVLEKKGKTLRIVVKNPEDSKTKSVIEELKKKGYDCRLFLGSLTGLKRAWQRYELVTPEAVSLRGVFNINQKELKGFEKSLKTIQELKEVIGSLTTTQLLSVVFAGAIKMGASDIHLEPRKENVRLRYRIDGVLQDITQLSRGKYNFILSRIKTLSDMLLNVTDVSQDGRFSIKIKDGEIESIDIRSSILPSAHGESIVLRLLGIAVAKLDLEKLGMKPSIFEMVKKQINQPNGMILSTGPTGSGKTTTLYACLNYVNKPGTKIITVENPIEYQLEGITQTQIDERDGHTFGQSLRGIVRQDPDVLMVGEIRDQESAEIAIQFSLTGHLVFSTLHTNDAVGAVPRLIGIKVEPSSLSSSLKIVIAQRLVRVLCPDCKKPANPSEEIKKAAKKLIAAIPKTSGIVIPKKLSFYQAKGCDKCHGLGYQGRIGVFEVMVINNQIEKLILDRATSYQLDEKARENGMTTLIQDALVKAIEGMTSLEEIERVIGSITLD